MKKEWFAAWFDSPYYHILYKSRDEQEAQNTLDHLLQALDLAPGATILDLACGKGRHARYLASKGFKVTGLDISEASIAFAREFEHDGLEFYQHDMRKPFRSNYFDGVMNMFTSFGYFESEKEHQQVIQHVAGNLKKGGLFLLDYFNSEWVEQHLVPEDEKQVDGITFQIKKRIKGGRVLKTVTFKAAGRLLTFTESVRLYHLRDFESHFGKSGLKIIKTFGDYQLQPFDRQLSPRLIMVAEKL